MDTIDYRAKSFDEVRARYKTYLIALGFSNNTVSTAYTDTFYLWRKVNKETFWRVLESDNFEDDARSALLNALRANSRGNVDSLIGGYMAHLRRFRRFLDQNPDSLPVAANHELVRRCKVRKNIPLMTVDAAVKLIRDYFNETVKDPHGRYMSWRHCYKKFAENRNATDEHIIDYLSLQLAFYLASWGMYRGSSFLLQKDYKVHIPVVMIIQEQKYNPLYSISAEDLCEEQNLDLLNDIAARIRGCYAKEQPSVDGIINNATDTLVTKILLGTLGCVPAFDRYYINSVKKNHISKGIFNKDSVRNVAEFYCDNLDVFEKLRYEISKCGIEYPPMKLMDMCFWQDAYIDDLKNKHHLDVAFETEE